MSNFTRGIDRAACLCDLRAHALTTKLGRGKMLDQVTQGIIDILRDTAREIRNITDPSVDVTTGPSEAAERVELRVALRSELERQCSIGAGTFVIDDGFAQSGLWQVNADLDSGSLIAALAQAQPQAS